MEQTGVVRHTLAALHRLELRYAIVGSFASIAYGEPRLTRDIDILIDLPRERVASLCEEFPAPEWYVSQPGALTAVETRRPFNVIHPTSGNKVDFIVARDDAWCELQFERRQLVGVFDDLLGYAVHPEDVILGKLLYYQQGGSDKHLRDIGSILAMSSAHIDTQRVTHWAAILNVEALWRQVLKRASE